MIARITEASVTKYTDNGQVQACVKWVDRRGSAGSTVGSPKNLHMEALLQRAEREDVVVRHETR